MKILTLEDRGSVSFYMSEALSELGHIVMEADTIGEAEEMWNAGEIDCLIVDLNMSPSGLKPEEQALTEGGVLSGWIWLKFYVYKTCKTLRHISSVEMKRRTIIYSEYLDQLRMKVPSKELRGIILIPKRGGEGAAELIRQVRAVASMIKKEIGK